MTGFAQPHKREERGKRYNKRCLLRLANALRFAKAMKKNK